MNAIAPLDRLPSERFDTPAILKKLAAVSRQLAELKGTAGTIPHQGILINTPRYCRGRDAALRTAATAIAAFARRLLELPFHEANWRRQQRL